MTTREQMMSSGENLGWCKPYLSDDGEDAIVVCEGKPLSLRLGGETIARNDENLQRFARAVNPDYDDYSGYDDLHIALDGNVRECGCAECPWFDSCEAMDGEADPG